MPTASVNDYAARVAEDAATHGYNGRDGKGAVLLKEAARAVRIAARNLEHRHNIPSIGADERGDYTSELVARLVGDAGGYLPDAASFARVYLIRRAEGIILNDRQRYGLDITEPAEGEAKGDPRLDGPLTIPEHIQAAADALPITETARRALIAAVVPATRQEWADFYGYSTPDSWRNVAKRGRRELYAIGEGPLRAALAQAEREAAEIVDEIEADLRVFMERS
ncbi:MAG TPA: hypothetical protein VNG33_10045 [Polyangiaceae bacterium]|nr:hypothetical protein [Polyangiaceae bacterium]